MEDHIAMRIISIFGFNQQYFASNLSVNERHLHVFAVEGKQSSYLIINIIDMQMRVYK